MRNFIYRILDIPYVYKLSQIILAPGKSVFMRKIWASAFDLNKTPVLDVGCGPALIGPRPKGLLFGVDISHDYLSAYVNNELARQEDSAPNKTFVALASSACLPFHAKTFLEVRAIGFLHHLPDGTVHESAKEMYRCLAPGGELVILEDIWPSSKWSRPIAWLIRRFDRGEFMRSEAELLTVLEEAIGAPDIALRRMYTFFGAELLMMKWKKY